jgi:hypothetical protein
LFQRMYFTHSIVQILNTLSSLNKINFTNPKKPKISAECFYIDDLCNYVDIATDYINWLSDHSVSIFWIFLYTFIAQYWWRSSTYHEIISLLLMSYTLNCLSRLYLQSLVPTNPHWACAMDNGLFYGTPAVYQIKLFFTTKE